ncbi:hypothetical protein HK100_009462 [Physocladia obscura]|uniref:Inositol hexakisphosphate-domain-containing protein n=1 Tax=Physocladia obscura TaxID=109957 RepID=A0AAD5T3Z0_9FUNG|nr:hypothetical protein HK100_009462 [Physocladia obscura]
MSQTPERPFSTNRPPLASFPVASTLNTRNVFIGTRSASASMSSSLDTAKGIINTNNDNNNNNNSNYNSITNGSAPVPVSLSPSIANFESGPRRRSFGSRSDLAQLLAMRATPSPSPSHSPNNNNRLSSYKSQSPHQQQQQSNQQSNANQQIQQLEKQHQSHLSHLHAQRSQPRVVGLARVYSAAHASPSPNASSENITNVYGTLDTEGQSPPSTSASHYLPRHPLNPSASDANLFERSHLHSFNFNNTNNSNKNTDKNNNNPTLTLSQPPPNPLQQLAAITTSVVRNRTGAVLARSTIIKSDLFDKSVNMNLDFHLQGAPNFRMTEYNICGVAQPTASGIATILTLLKSNPEARSKKTTLFICAREEPVIYINWRPFVLRDADSPFQNIKTFQGISGARLEQLEARLKEDIVRESKKHGNMFLAHDEIEYGRIVPSWVAIEDIMTTKDVFTALQAKNFRVVYHRIPISPEQSPEDKYLDEYVAAIKLCHRDDYVVFNCGMGVGRTTFAMTVAMILRRTRQMAETEPDIITPGGSWLDTLSSSSESSTEPFFVDETDRQNRAMLRLVYILERGLSNNINPRSAIDWAMARGPLIEDLKNAVLGNYQYIQLLTSLLHRGTESKRILDEAIDKCDVMINLREVILLHRVQYSNTGDAQILEKALGCLERYFFLLSFCSYVIESSDLALDTTFFQWLDGRQEIRRMMDSITKRGMRLQVFKPVEDLSLFSNEGQGHMYMGRHRPMANELESFVMKWRHGSVLVQHTILKVDQWVTESQETPALIDGTLNFRKIPNWSVYGVAQPTIQGLVNIMKALTATDGSVNPSIHSKKAVCWINLREEPICYVNGQAYVLRDKNFTLRNTKAYSGIASSRLEDIEIQLKEDVISELRTFESKILIHTETAENIIHPVWEECTPEYVLTAREVVELLTNEGYPIEYYRVPLTAERAPDPAEMDDLVHIFSSIDLQNTAIVLNCQVGLGRSTVGTIVASLVLDWLKGLKSSDNLNASILTDKPSANFKAPLKPLNYQVIHALIRVIRNGASCRRWVDQTIDGCSTQNYHIREAIEIWRKVAESESNESQRRRAVRKGLACLRRYFSLIAFAAYLDSKSNHTEGSELESFKNWVSGHQEFETMLEEMEQGGFKSLVPVEHLMPGDGIALTNEVINVVDGRNGAVLAKHTILKVDVFPGAQKLSLLERVDGAPNYRKISLLDILNSIGYYPKTHSVDGRSVYGIGMPTTDAIKNTLNRCNAGPGGTVKVLWTSLREEPVIYVKGRPFVLRLFQEPMKNLETTGIIRERVEQMEEQMKSDCKAELERYGGRLLLHDEEMIGSGFSIVPIWETCSVDDIKTSLEIYQSIIAENYRVDYKRVPITDEQAPIPAVFDELVERLTGLEEKSEAVFNCQMGRGRTTTGIVISCLLQMIVGNKDLLHNPSFLFPNELAVSPTPFGPSGIMTEMDSDRERYNAGEYKIILQLVAALDHGRLAKKLTDRAIDKCEHLQNLRIAIYDYKLRLNALEENTQKWLALKAISLNYLMRYFYLIVFAEYLIEEVSETAEWPAKPKQTFTKWLEDRREILNIGKLKSQTLE